MVSIIIPVYQVSAYIERCIQSVLNQTYTDVECFIVDDATPDDSIKQCEQLIEQYEGPIQFRILHHECNRGLSAARNTGTDAATGEYIYYLDSDDEITPDCIEKLYTLAKAFPETEMVVGNNKRIATNGQVHVSIGRNIPMGVITRIEFLEYFQKYLLPKTAWNKLVKRSFLIHNNICFREGVLFEDLLWSFYIIKYLSNLCVCKDVTYYYYIRPNSLISTYNNYSAGISFITIYDEILQNITQGQEKLELGRYVDGFCERYVRFEKEIPSYSGLMKTYQNLARKHHCFKVRLKLDSALLLSRLPFRQQITKKVRVFKIKLLRRQREVKHAEKQHKDQGTAL